MARGLPFSKDARSYHPRAHHLRRLLHQQLDALSRAPVRRPHYGRGYAPHATPFGYYGSVWFCSALVNSDTLIAYYGVKQSQFTKPTPEPPR